MNYKLFLDDIRTPNSVYDCFNNDWIVARDYNEFVNVITQSGAPEVISFDHDLGEAAYAGDYNSEKTGYDCAKWIVENNIKVSNIHIHSFNPVGADKIRSLFDNAIIVQHRKR